MVLDHYLAAGAVLTTEVATRFEPATPLASHRLTVPTEHEVAATHQAFANLTAPWTTPAAGGNNRPLTLLHTSDTASTGDLLTIDVAVGCTADPAALPAPLRRHELPAGPVIETTHHGPYEAIGIAHAAIHAWAQEHGHHPTGPLREVYLNDPATALRTRVLMPIQPAEPG